jgi:(S)-3,5-dihydroxyphenylglycine transaminase
MEQAVLSAANAASAEMSRIDLDSSSLHGSLRDPVIDSLNLLNEIIDRYPNAISFGPGAPHRRFLEDLDVTPYIQRYVEYLKQEKGLGETAIQRHLYQYGPSQGQITELVSRALLRDFGVNVPPQSIVMTVGCQEAMWLALRALFATPADVLAVVQPCFVGIVGAARLLNLEVQAVDEGEDGVDIDQLSTACRRARAAGKHIRAVYVAPDYSNPSGTLMSVAARHELLQLAEKEDFFLLEDNAYGFTAAQGAAHPPLKALDRNARVIYLGTFAKICVPGVRVGFAVADQRVRHGETHRYLAQELATIKSMLTVNTSPICQAIVGGMLLEHETSLTALAQEKGAFYRDNLQCLLDALERHLGPRGNSPYHVSWNVPQGGFFVRVQTSFIVDEEMLKLSAERHGVLWTPMANFMLGGAQSRELRLSCSYLTREQIEEGVPRLARFIEDANGSARRA